MQSSRVLAVERPYCNRTKEATGQYHILVAVLWTTRLERRHGWKMHTIVFLSLAMTLQFLVKEHNSNMFGDPFVNNKVTIDCSNWAGDIQKALDTKIVEFSQARALSQPRPFDVQIFTRLLTTRETSLRRHCSFVCNSTKVWICPDWVLQHFPTASATGTWKTAFGSRQNTLQPFIL